MKQTFQGIPIQFPAPTLNLVGGGGGIETRTGTYWFWLQGQNRQGFNQLSAEATIALSAGDRLDITVPATCRPASDGSDIRRILLLGSRTNDPSTAVNLAAIDGSNLPEVISIANDDHLAMGLAQMLADAADLPDNPVRGMRRSLDAWDEIREWSGSAWLRCEPQLFSTYLDSVDGEFGARQDIALASTSLTQPVAYGVDGSESEVLTYWLINDSSVPVEASTGIACTIESGGKDISSMINNGSLWMAFGGYANATTAARDTLNAAQSGDMAGIDEWLEYPGEFTGIVLPKDLLPGHAIAMSFRLTMDEVTAQFAAYEGQRIGIRLSLEPYTAHLVPLGLFFGNLLAAESGRRRVLPGGSGTTLLGLPGTGVLRISSSQAYLFRDRPAQPVAGLSPDTANQSVYVSAQGNLFVASVSGTTSALRAIVGTVNGVGAAVPAGAVELGASQRLTVQVPIPISIRADYPDVIAGTEAAFNASFIRVYAKPPTGNLLYWDIPIPLGQPIVALTISTAGTDLGSDTLPAVAAAFGLYSPSGALSGVAAGSSSFVDGQHQIYAAFGYTGTVTEISHSTAKGCIPEVDGPLADIFEIAQYLGPHVNSLHELRQLGVRIPYRQIFCVGGYHTYRWLPAEVKSSDFYFNFSSEPDPTGILVGQVRVGSGQMFFALVDAEGVSLESGNFIDGLRVGATITLIGGDFSGAAAAYKVEGKSLQADHYQVDVTELESVVFENSSKLLVTISWQHIRPYGIDLLEPGRWVNECCDLPQASQSVLPSETPDNFMTGASGEPLEGSVGEHLTI